VEKENKTKNFVLRVDAELMAAIEKWAADEFRSTNGQILYLLDQALKKSGRTPRSKGAQTGSLPHKIDV
jgi:Uncharacterized protein conserved in bacteria